MSNHTPTNQEIQKKEKFMEAHNLPRLNHYEVENQNRPVSNKYIELITKKLSISKSIRSDGLTGDIYQAFGDYLIPILLKFSQKISEFYIFWS